MTALADRVYFLTTFTDTLIHLLVHFLIYSPNCETLSLPVDLCLKALKHLLPSSVALQVLGQWYTVRNAPGGVGNVPEWSMFIKCILGLIGYDTSKLRLTSKVMPLLFCPFLLPLFLFFIILTFKKIIYVLFLLIKGLFFFTNQEKENYSIHFFFKRNRLV